MKKYQIALTGTFDVENFGDLMFPYVFERAMKKRGLNFELTLFSPSDAAEMALDETRKVYSYKDFRRLNEKLHFDALVVGGGALIHYGDFELKMPKEEDYSVYHNVNSWLTMIYLAAESNVKILMNVPQVPFEIPKSLAKLTGAVLEQVDYIAVRDETSKKYLLDMYSDDQKVPEIEVFPDTVSIVDELYENEELEKRRRELLHGIGKYMVLHFQSINELDAGSKAAYKAIAKDAKEKGLEVVLLPIGYTFGDDLRMREFNAENNSLGIEFNRKLKVIDILAILAGCEYYIGYSFHGAVVTMAYGGRAYSLNPSLKNQELFNNWSVPERLDNDYKKLLLAINNSKENGFKNPSKIKELVNRHFDNLYEMITSEAEKKKNSEKLLEEIVLVIPILIRVLDEKARCEAKIRMAVKENEALKKEFMEKEKVVLEEKELIKKLQKDLELTRNSNAFKVGSKIMKPLHYVKRLRGNDKND